MSCFSGPEISEDRLVFYYDMNNPLKSWRGAPATNLIDVTENLLSPLWTREGGFGTVTANYGIAPDGSQTSTRLQYSGGYFYRSTTNTPAITALTAGTTTTFSCWVRGNPQSGRGIGLWSYAVGGIVTTSTQTINPISWTRVSLTYTIAAGATSFAIMLAGDPGNIFQGDIEVWRPQLEVGTFATPFVNGTRSTTQSILDLTGNNTITTNSLTYATDGTFRFNGSTDFISTNYVGNTSSFTHEVFLRPTNVAKDQMYIGYGAIPANYVRIVNSRAYVSVLVATGQQIHHDPQILANNTNYHIVSSYNGSQLKIYVNGVLSSSTFNSPLTGWGVDRIGRWLDVDQRAFEGTIFNLKTYNRELSELEVQQNFNALRTRYGI